LQLSSARRAVARLGASWQYLARINAEYISYHIQKRQTDNIERWAIDTAVLCAVPVSAHGNERKVFAFAAGAAGGVHKMVQTAESQILPFGNVLNS
jgi:hypothetical protein